MIDARALFVFTTLCIRQKVEAWTDDKHSIDIDYIPEMDRYAIYIDGGPSSPVPCDDMQTLQWLDEVAKTKGLNLSLAFHHETYNGVHACMHGSDVSPHGVSPATAENRPSQRSSGQTTRDHGQQRRRKTGRRARQH